jgi:hypothetical protein
MRFLFGDAGFGFAVFSLAVLPPNRKRHQGFFLST